MGYLLIGLFLLWLGCGPAIDPAFESLLRKEPWVVDVDPPDGAEVSQLKQVAIRFSRPIAPETVRPTSVAVIEMGGEKIDIADLSESVVAGKALGIPQRLLLDDDHQHLRLLPEGSFQAGKRYGVIVTEAIRTSEALPLNQHPALGQSAFWSEFTILQSSSESDAASISPTPNEEEIELPSLPPLQRPAKLVINEILYDAAGSDTDGVVFVELAGEPPGSDLANYQLHFIDGGDGAVYKTIALPALAQLDEAGLYVVADSRTGAAGSTQVADADLIASFDPRNGPDALQLVDDRGELLDALGYGAMTLQTAANGLRCIEGSPAEDAPADASLTRLSGADSDDNSVDFKIQASPTPGVL